MSIISEISKLIDAGFTKDDIKQFYDFKSKDSEPETKPETKPKDEPKKETEKETKSDFDSLTSQITEITKLLQASNIIRDEQPKPRTIDDIFESMFADERDDKEE